MFMSNVIAFVLTFLVITSSLLNALANFLLLSFSVFAYLDYIELKLAIPNVYVYVVDRRGGQELFSLGEDGQNSYSKII
jgi:hypothetical protein